MPPPDNNFEGLAPVPGRKLAAVGAGSGSLPKLFLRSPDAGKRFWEFFTAHIRNRNTRRAYFVAVAQFSDWCEAGKLSLLDCKNQSPSGSFVMGRAEDIANRATSAAP